MTNWSRAFRAMGACVAVTAALMGPSADAAIKIGDQVQLRHLTPSTYTDYQNVGASALAGSGQTIIVRDGTGAVITIASDKVDVGSLLLKKGQAGIRWPSAPTPLGVTLAAVPEPATWALMIAGFGLVGAAMRGQRKRITVGFA